VAKKEGWQKGISRSKYSKDDPGITNAPEQNEDAGGKSVANEIYNNNDAGAYRGTRPGFS
jgi:hypothetical protein